MQDWAVILLLLILICWGTVNQFNINPVYALKYSKISGSKYTDAEIVMPEPPGAMGVTWSLHCHVKETATFWKDSKTPVTKGLP